jgi:hypothetical protein
MQTRQTICNTLIDAAPTLIPLLPASLADVYTTVMMGGSIASYVFGADAYAKHDTPASYVRMAFLFLRDHDRYAALNLYSVGPDGLELAPHAITAHGLDSVEYYIKKAVNQVTQK